jgi:adenylate kinase family enzyme
MPAEISGPRRLFIIGASGGGKTTLAAALAASLHQNVHHLDEIARVGGGNGPARSDAERSAAVSRILADDAWIVEGIHLGWTDPLLEAADLVIWLDHVSWTRASHSIVRRFVSEAVAEMRRQKGWRKVTRVRSFGSRLKELLAAIPETRTYHSSSATDDSRAATARRLQPLADKVVHCRSKTDVALIARKLTTRSE